jgi:DNA-binding response OmpR family regulator
MSTTPVISKASARCLVVDPNPASATALADLLAHEGYEVRVVATGEAAVELCVSWRPDLAFLEWELPGIHGPRIAQMLLDACDPFVVMITSRDSEIDRVTALSTIADDYISRPYSDSEVIARVRAILRRQRVKNVDQKPQTILEAGELSLDTGMRSGAYKGEPVEFTRLEFDILATLLRNAPRPVQRKTLIQEAWGDTSAASTHTLDVHASRLRQKLLSIGVNTLSIESIRGFGLRLSIREV